MALHMDPSSDGYANDDRKVWEEQDLQDDWEPSEADKAFNEWLNGFLEEEAYRREQKRTPSVE